MSKRSRRRDARVESLQRAADRMSAGDGLLMLENDELVWATYLFHRFRHREAELIASHEVRLRLSERGMAAEMRALVTRQQGPQMSDRAALRSPVAERLLAKVGA